MPRLSVWAVRASLIYLLAGFTLGGLLLANKGLGLWPGVWSVLPAHIEFLLTGWMAHLALGVAFWILPRFPGGSRGMEWPAWAAFVLLNVGVFLVGFGPEPWTAVWGRLAQALGVGLFLLHAWKRIRPMIL